jgi:hypothetical protein
MASPAFTLHSAKRKIHKERAVMGSGRNGELFEMMRALLVPAVSFAGVLSAAYDPSPSKFCILSGGVYSQSAILHGGEKNQPVRYRSWIRWVGRRARLVARDK